MYCEETMGVLFLQVEYVYFQSRAFCHFFMTMRATSNMKHEYHLVTNQSMSMKMFSSSLMHSERAVAF